MKLNPRYAATFGWQKSNGAGQTITTATDINWKNIDDNSTAYSASSITAGNNSYEQWLAGHLSGTFNSITAGLFAHTTTSFGSYLTLKGVKAMTADGDRLTYTTPSTTANTNLTTDMTATEAIGSGVAVWFGITSANASGKAATFSTANTDNWTNYLTTQLQTAVGVAAGDTAQVTVTLQYNEN
jgi:hypothetical protein